MNEIAKTQMQDTQLAKYPSYVCTSCGNQFVGITTDGICGKCRSENNQRSHEKICALCGDAFIGVTADFCLTCRKGIRSGSISKEKLEDVSKTKKYKVAEANTVPAKCPGCEAKHLVPESERRKGLKFVPVYCSDCKYKRNIPDVEPLRTYW